MVAVTEVTGRVRGKIAIIGDDVITTGGTLLAGVEALKEHGARRSGSSSRTGSSATARSRKFDDAGHRRDRRHRHRADRPDSTKPDNMTVLTVAPLLAETIMNVFADDSVSAIFGGENQLF